MTDEPDLDAILDGKVPAAQRRRRFTTEVSKARNLEQTRRSMEARRLVLKAMERLHPNEYESLYHQALDRVAKQRGPLPGDEE